ALDVDLAALAEILLGDPRETFREDHYPVPLGPLLALPGILVAPVLRRRDAEIDDLATAGQRTHLRIRAQIAYQDHLVHAAVHGSLLPYFPAAAEFRAAALVYPARAGKGRNCSNPHFIVVHSMFLPYPVSTRTGSAAGNSSTLDRLRVV